MPPWCPERGARGFTLVEVLFALAIVGLALGAAATVFGNGILGHRAASNVDTALALAETKLAEAGVTAPLQAGESGGIFAGRFAWSVAIAPYDDRELAGLAPSAVTLYRIVAHVAWRDGRRGRAIAIETLRLSAAPP